jgi:hypothetical protein
MAKAGKRSGGTEVTCATGPGPDASGRSRVPVPVAAVDATGATASLFRLLTWLANCGLDAGSPPLLQRGRSQG